MWKKFYRGTKTLHKPFKIYFFARLCLPTSCHPAHCEHLWAGQISACRRSKFFMDFYTPNDSSQWAQYSVKRAEVQRALCEEISSKIKTVKMALWKRAREKKIERASWHYKSGIARARSSARRHVVLLEAAVVCMLFYLRLLLYVCLEAAVVQSKTMYARIIRSCRFELNLDDRCYSTPAPYWGNNTNSPIFNHTCLYIVTPP